jgi:ElaB/YqjD/DUF883 family membrane-anchored ribosome-binding protein
MTGPARREKHSPKHPWIIPTIAVAAGVIVVVGLLIVAVNGWRMF